MDLEACCEKCEKRLAKKINMNKINQPKALPLALILLNIFDAVLHITTDNIEILRISGNILLLFACLGVIAHNKLNRFKIVLWAGIINLLLNGIFIFNEGIGVLGVLFILASSVLVAIHSFKLKK